MGRVEWIPGDSHIEPGEPMIDINNMTYVESVDRKSDSTGKEPQNLDELLERNKTLFAETDMDLGCTNLVSMKIDTGKSPPIASKPY